MSYLPTTVSVLLVMLAPSSTSDCSAGISSSWLDSFESLIMPESYVVNRINASMENYTENAKYLILENQNISTLQSMAFVDFPFLEVVVLCSSGVEQIDELAFYNTSLTHIYLARNYLTSIPNLTDPKPFIEVLDLSFNEIGWMEACAFVGFLSLQSILLQYNKLTVLADLSALPWREYRENAIQIPSTRWEKYSNSRVINVVGNMISVLLPCSSQKVPFLNCSSQCKDSEEVHQRLTVFFLRQNNFSVIRNSTYSLVPGLNLLLSDIDFDRACNLSNFQLVIELTLIFNAFSASSKYETLEPYLLCNDTDLIDDKPKLIIDLGIDRSNLFYVPIIDPYEKYIRTLSLVGNQIAYIPKEYFSKMALLRSLVISGNKLTRFPDISLVPKLLQLTLISNDINFPVIPVANNSLLQYVYAGLNKLTEFPFTTYPLGSLKFVFTVGNKISYLDDKFLCLISALDSDSDFRGIYRFRQNQVQTLPDFHIFDKPFPLIDAESNPLVCNCSLAHTFHYIESPTQYDPLNHSYVYTDKHVCPPNSDPYFAGNIWKKENISHSSDICYREQGQVTSPNLDCDRLHQEARDSLLQIKATTEPYSTQSVFPGTSSVKKATQDEHGTSSWPFSSNSSLVDLTRNEGQDDSIMSIAMKDQSDQEITPGESNASETKEMPTTRSVGQEDGVSSLAMQDKSDPEITPEEINAGETKETLTTSSTDVNLQVISTASVSEVEREGITGKCRKFAKLPSVIVWRKRIRPDNLGGLTIRNVIIDSKFDCLDVCLKSWCCSIYFNPNNGSCLTHQTETAEWLLTKDDGWKFFTLIKGKTRQ